MCIANTDPQFRDSHLKMLKSKLLTLIRSKGHLSLHSLSRKMNGLTIFPFFCPRGLDRSTHTTMTSQPDEIRQATDGRKQKVSH